MALYKGIEVDPAIAPMLRYMQGVEDCREGLNKLQSSWDVLTLLGQLTGAATEMTGTRAGFEQLTAELLNHLGKQTLHKSISDLREKTQVGIDILVRNLFERTADIGFLSTDDDIREFLEVGGEAQETLQNRFQEYVAKYSVYSDIVLFDTSGCIRARLKPHPAERSGHAVVGEALETAAGYVEYFGPADFLPPGDHLIYAFRVENTAGERIGVLVLLFCLKDEMASVFANLANAQDPTLLATVTREGRVVASASQIQLPVGTPVDTSILHADGDLVRLAGRDYLAVVCQAHSYQGYPGPDWLGLGLIPIEFAFEVHHSQRLDGIDAKLLHAVSEHPALFSQELREIPTRAENIQEDLNRSVWNGSVRQFDATNGNVSFVKTLLWEISNTGRKTQAVFEQAISDLHQTVATTLLQNCVSRAAFVINVMDRNLYERANDCRWWALNGTFRRTLAAGNISPDSAAECAAVLRYINGLYTVYSNLILFGMHGEVIAVSDPDAEALVGSRLLEEWVGRCLSSTSSSHYVVSRFADTPLYGEQPTYVYAAAVHAPEGNHPVGGIAIVFDGTPQFAAMLADALPQDESAHPLIGAHAMFVQSDGRILASATPEFVAGTLAPITNEQRSMRAGQRRSAIVEYRGDYYALGAAMSAGYREFKTSDGYSDDVLAVVAVRLGAVTLNDIERRHPAKAAQSRGRRHGTGKEAVEIATFYVGQQWLGLPSNSVVEAISTDEMSPVFGNHCDLMAGVKSYRGNLISILYLNRILSPGMAIPESARQIVVVRTKGRACLGLLVDELGEIPEIEKDEIQAISHFAASGNTLTSGVVNMTQDGETRVGILSVLDADHLCSRIGRSC